MSNKLIIRLSNNLGNQMFMYASGYSFAKQLNRNFFIDEESSFSSKKNIYNYGLNSFYLTSKIAPKNLKFLNLSGYIKKKIIKKIDNFKKNKNFYIEDKNKDKITFYSNDFLKKNYNVNLFIEGHFESEKYFLNYENDIRNEFTFKYIHEYKNNPFYKQIIDSNSVSICIRQHRFSEKVRSLNNEDLKKSEIFSDEQIKYVKKSINIIKTKINNPKFFLWSNDYTGLNNHFPESEFTMIVNDKYISKEKIIGLDLFLMTQAKNFIVVPTSYNWWGCWLSSNNEKIVLRPSDNHFSNFKINNKDFWPESWIKV